MRRKQNTYLLVYPDEQEFTRVEKPGSSFKWFKGNKSGPDTEEVDITLRRILESDYNILLLIEQSKKEEVFR